MAMSKGNYSLLINRPLQEVLKYLASLDENALPGDGGLSFEAVRGSTRIIYKTSQGVSGFFKLADVLISQLSRADQGRNVPELVFEP
jgi:hypothetical protein